MVCGSEIPDMLNSEIWITFIKIYKVATDTAYIKPLKLSTNKHHIIAKGTCE